MARLLKQSVFKRDDVVDEYGNSVKEKLDRLLIIFANEYQLRLIDNPTVLNLNLWTAIDSKILGLSLYYLVVQLKLSYINQNQKEFQYYQSLLTSKLNNSFVNLDVQELINSFELTSKERIDLYDSYSKNYAVQNNRALLILFRGYMNLNYPFPMRHWKKQRVIKKQENRVTNVIVAF